LEVIIHLVILKTADMPVMMLGIDKISDIVAVSKSDEKLP
jgi:hypothetical protein